MIEVKIKDENGDKLVFWFRCTKCGNEIKQKVSVVQRIWNDMVGCTDQRVICEKCDNTTFEIWI